MTAHGNRDLFQLVEAIVEDEVSLSCWEIKPFKPPPRHLQALADDTGFNVAKWRFIPLKSDANFSQIGLILIIDSGDAIRLDYSRALSILEHLVGEVLLAACSHVEVTTATGSEGMPIEILMETLHSWVLLRGDDQLRQYLPALD